MFGSIRRAYFFRIHRNTALFFPPSQLKGIIEVTCLIVAVRFGINFQTLHWWTRGGSGKKRGPQLNAPVTDGGAHILKLLGWKPCDRLVNENLLVPVDSQCWWFVWHLQSSLDLCQLLIKGQMLIKNNFFTKILFVRWPRLIEISFVFIVWF